MATGEYVDKIPWSYLTPIQSDILPPGSWNDLTFQELSRLRVPELYALMERLKKLDPPFKFQKCVRPTTASEVPTLLPAVYNGMPRKGNTPSVSIPSREGSSEAPHPRLRKNARSKLVPSKDSISGSGESDESGNEEHFDIGGTDGSDEGDDMSQDGVWADVCSVSNGEAPAYRGGSERALEEPNAVSAFEGKVPERLTIQVGMLRLFRYVADMFPLPQTRNRTPEERQTGDSNTIPRHLSPLEGRGRTPLEYLTTLSDDSRYRDLLAAFPKQVCSTTRLLLLPMLIRL